MTQAIREICSWGQGKFDGWIIPKAVYRRYNGKDTVRFQTRLLAHRRRYVRVQTIGYTAAGTENQCLEVTLIHSPPGEKACGSGKDEPGNPDENAAGLCADEDCSAGGLSFSVKGLKQFLWESGDTNPLHQGEPALVPGLWILETLYGPYARTLCPVELAIRFLCPLYTGQQIVLKGNHGSVSGVCGSCTYFHMTIQSISIGGNHED